MTMIRDVSYSIPYRRILQKSLFLQANKNPDYPSFYCGL